MTRTPRFTPVELSVICIAGAVGAKIGDSLISRGFSGDQHLEVVVIVDAGRSSGLRAVDLDRFGHYVNVAASLAENVVARGDLGAGAVS